MRLEAREHRERTGRLEMFSTWTAILISSFSKFPSFDLLLLLLLLQVSKGEEVASAALPEENRGGQEENLTKKEKGFIKLYFIFI